MEETSKVYVLCDSQGRIVRIEGGYTIDNIKDMSSWILVDEGYGDRYNLCQGNYLPTPLHNERGILRYKLVDGQVVPRIQAEIDADAEAISDMQPEMPNIEALLLEMAGDHEYRLCLLELGVSENDL